MASGMALRWSAAEVSEMLRAVVGESCVLGFNEQGIWYLDGSERIEFARWGEVRAT